MHILFVHYVSLVVPLSLSDLFKDFFNFNTLVSPSFLERNSLLTDTYVVRSNTTTSHGTNQLFIALCQKESLFLKIYWNPEGPFSIYCIVVVIYYYLCNG